MLRLPYKVPDWAAATTQVYSLTVPKPNVSGQGSAGWAPSEGSAEDPPHLSRLLVAPGPPRRGGLAGASPSFPGALSSHVSVSSPLLRPLLTRIQVHPSLITPSKTPFPNSQVVGVRTSTCLFKGHNSIPNR